jgi:5-guanidino-2-oxopentanoate decarboxylase
MAQQKPLGVQISQALKDRDVDVIFGIPGVHNVELYRGIEEAGITHVLTRHEQGAGFMADGYARATGKPGVAYVITGPGLCNIMTPMGQAYSDSVPMLVVSSCLNPADLTTERGRLHEMRNQEAAAATVCGWSKTALDADAAYDLIDRAFDEFESARARPKHIQVPISVLGALADPAPAAKASAVVKADQIGDIAPLVGLVASAQKPMVVLGGGAASAHVEIRKLLSKLNAASIATYAGRGVADVDDPLHLGSYLARPDTVELISQADLVIVLGSTLSEVDLWREFLGHSAPMIRVDIDPAVLADQHRAEHRVLCDVSGFAAALYQKIDNKTSTWKPADISAAKSRFYKSAAAERPGLLPVIEAARNAVPNDALIYSDMTQFAYSAKEVWPMSEPSLWHHPFGFGTLGYALPAAIGGKVGRPDRDVIAIAGDYGFHYTMQELGVAVELELTLPIILWDNGKLKEIEDCMVANQIAPNAVIARNPDFCALARAFGASAVAPKSLSDFEAAITSALGAKGPTLIYVTPSIIDG